jgi:ribosomal protein S18 acetylase RimI-like enzyme
MFGSGVEDFPDPSSSSKKSRRHPQGVGSGECNSLPCPIGLGTNAVQCSILLHSSDTAGSPPSPDSLLIPSTLPTSSFSLSGFQCGSPVHSQTTTNSLTTSESLFFSVPTTWNIHIRHATIKDYKRIARTLQLAFEYDPFILYVLKLDKTKSKRKKDLMLAYYEYSVYECLSLGGTIHIIEDCAFETSLSLADFNNKQKSKLPFLAVSLWNKTFDGVGRLNEDNLSFFDNIHSSYFKYELQTFIGNCRKTLNAKIPFLTKVRNQLLAETLLGKIPDPVNIWYLWDLGILPSAQGKGFGRILLQHAINQMKNSYIYLESSNPVNRQFYEKLNFSLLASFSVKSSKFVDSHQILVDDPNNDGIIMDSMILRT